MQVSHGDAPRMANRRIAAGQRQILQLRRTPEAVVAAHEPFPAPDRAVPTIARAIQRYADDRAGFRRAAIIRQTSRDVRLVMLHLERRRQAVLPGVLLRKACCEIVRVHVGNHPLRRDAEKMLVSRQRSFVVRQRFQILHIADVLAYKRELILCERERVLQQRANRQQGARREREPDGKRGVAPSAADELHHRSTFFVLGCVKRKM